MNQPIFKKDIVVIYHGGCADGFGGAWAAWKKFGDKAHYYGASHSEPPLVGLKDKIIYFIDFSYPADATRKLIANNRRVTALDHHVSAEQVVKMTQDYRYAEKHSGCYLAWRYFHPGKPVPKLLLHLEDIDLRVPAKLKDSRAIRTLMEAHGLNFKVWDGLVKKLDHPSKCRELLEQGRLLVQYQNRLVRELVDGNAQFVKFVGYKVYAVNSPFLEDYIAQELIRRKPPMAIIWRARDNVIRVSLRSDGSVDVAKIARRYGGGGHKQSSGFNIRFGEKLPWTKING